MNIDQNEVDFLVNLAKECEGGDPIDWGPLQITEEQAYQMMASSLLEQFAELPEDHRLHVALATATKLLVENFVLNLRIHGGEDAISNRS